MNNEVTQYIEQAPALQSRIMEKVRALIHASIPGVIEEFKWSRPVFRTDKDLAYLKSAKAYVTLGFNVAEKLSDPMGRLEGTGKSMKHIKLRSMEDIDENQMLEWFKAASS